MLSRDQLAVRTAAREELTVFAYQIWKPQFLSISNRQLPFAVLSDNVFEMGVYREWNIYRGVITQVVVKTLNFEISRCLLADYVVEKYFKKMVWTLNSAEDGFRTGCRSVSH